MPELPEVEVIMRGITPHIQDKTFSQISWSNHKLRLPIPRKKLQSLIEGTKITEVARRAKYLIISVNNGAMLVIHLGMTGNLGIFPKTQKKAKHDHLCFLMEDGMELRYNDTRRFGSIQVFGKNDVKRDNFFGSLGPEPFWDDFSASYLMKKAKGRQQPIKNFLMDSRVVVGIGNIYANEILFATGFRPTRAIGRLTSKNWAEIIKKTRTILTDAISAGGSTISDFVNSSGEKGYFQLSLKVYGHKGEKCPQCGNIIEKIVMAGRATFFCGKCQK
jgi:formamidopyrimidine-DNA glycosylase